MGGYVTQSRKPMLNSKLSYNTRSRYAGVDYPWSNLSVSKDSVFGLTSLDSVYSYRSNVDEESELKYLLSNEEFSPFTQHDNGHEFWSHKRYVKNVATYGKQNFYCSIRGSSGSRDYWYRGPILFERFVVIPSSVRTLWGLAQNDIVQPDLVSYGTKAIAAAAPTRSSASLATALLELRDGLPKIPGMALTKTKKYQNVHGSLGDEYLNILFGWVPTISDIRQILKGMVNAGKILDQYARDSDRFVRRKHFFAPVVENQLAHVDDMNWLAAPCWADGSSYTTPGMISADGSTGVIATDGRGSLSLSYQRHVKTWFSGAYRYHLENGDSLYDRIKHYQQLAARLLGARLDLAAIWAATPWSWLIDWLTDVGDIIANGTAASLDGQVLQYGYLMQSDTRTVTVSTDAPVAVKSQSGNIQKVGNLATTFVNQRKDRIRATPFGFGLNPNSFSAQQWAILGALGLTKGPRSLW